MKLLHITDTHLCDRPLGNRKASYPEEMKEKMLEVINLCIEERRHLVHTGDFFEHKPPRHTSHGLIQWLIKQFNRLWQEDLMVIGIPGNHDLSEAGLDSLSKQPLGVLQEAGAVRLVGLNYDVEYIDGIAFKGFPYEPEGEFDPDYFYFGGDRQPFGYHRPLVYLTHGALVPDRIVKNFPTIKYSEIDRENVDLVLCGHMHDDYGEDKLDGTLFVQYGSLSRRSRTQQRDVTVAKIDIDKNYVYAEPYVLKSQKDWREIFLDLGVAQSITINPDLAALAKDTLSMQNTENVDYYAFLEEIAPNLREPVRTRVLNYIEQAEHLSLR